MSNTLVPFSFEIGYLPKGYPDHFPYAHAAETLLSDNPDGDTGFVSIDNSLHPTREGEKAGLEIALAAGEASKVMPIIDLTGIAGMTSVLEKAALLKQKGIEGALLSIPVPDHQPDLTARHIAEVREAGELKSLGIIIPVTAASQHVEREITVPAHTAERLDQVDFGVTQALLNPATYSQVLQSLQVQGVSRPVVPGVQAFSDYEAVEEYIELNKPAGAKLLRNASIDAPGLEKFTGARLNNYFAHMAAIMLNELGAPGLHIYTGNNMKATQRLVETIKYLTRLDTQSL
jgi:hypothetical protein